MTKLITPLFFLILIGCGSNQALNGGTYGYEEVELGDGLHHVKYTFVNWRGFTDGMREKWTERSAIVCNDLIAKQHLYLEHIRILGSSTNITWIGAGPVVYPEERNVAVIEGVVQCNPSNLSENEVQDILIEGMFIFK